MNAFWGFPQVCTLCWCCYNFLGIKMWRFGVMCIRDSSGSLVVVVVANRRWGASSSSNLWTWDLRLVPCLLAWLCVVSPNGSEADAHTCMTVNCTKLELLLFVCFLESQWSLLHWDSSEETGIVFSQRRQGLCFLIVSASPLSVCVCLRYHWTINVSKELKRIFCPPPPSVLHPDTANTVDWVFTTSPLTASCVSSHLFTQI